MGNWGQVVKLTASDAQAFDEFGMAVAVDGDTVAVGAWHEDGGPGDPLEDAGAVYMFERDEGGPGNWGQADRLTAADAQAGDLFGIAAAIAGDQLVIGAAAEDGGPGDPFSEAGAAYLFESDQAGSGKWDEVARLSSGDAAPSDFFGTDVAIRAGLILVGVYLEDGGPGDPVTDAGAAYLFATNVIYLPVVDR